MRILTRTDSEKPDRVLGMRPESGIPERRRIAPSAATYPSSLAVGQALSTRVCPAAFFLMEDDMPTTDELAQFMMGKLKEQFKELVGGATEDVDAFFAELSSDYAQAAITGNQELVNEIQGQLSMLAEKHRLNFQNSTLDTLSMVLQGVAGIIIRFLI